VRTFLAYALDFLVALTIGALIWLALSSCTLAKQAGGEVGGTIVESTACPLGWLDCGSVYMFEAEADNELGHVEMCLDLDDHPEDLESAEALFGPAVPTPRHQGVCVVTCDEPSPLPGGRGCNCLTSSYCPERP
jgi:hypothetical protein